MSCPPLQRLTSQRAARDQDAYVQSHRAALDLKGGVVIDIEQACVFFRRNWFHFFSPVVEVWAGMRLSIRTFASICRVMKAND
jgi:hypothetical protein